MKITYKLRHLGRLLCAGILLLAVAAAPAAALNKVHVVQRGETLSSIARRYDVPISVLAAHNGIDNSDYIFVGQRMVVPVSETALTPSLGIHTVRVGDSLTDIAALYGVPLEKILFFNGMDSPSALWVGQPVLVPVPATPGPPPSAAAPAPIVADPNATSHQVRQGDTLYSISRAYGVDVQTLATHNRLQDVGRLFVGQTLSLPRNPPTAPAVGTSQSMPRSSSVVHTVTLGDSLNAIANRCKVTVRDLMLLNGLDHASLLWVGQNLALPQRVDGSEPLIVPAAVPQPAAAQEPPLPVVDPIPDQTGLPQLPASFVHIVKRGETLADIARRFKATALQVSNYNGLESRDLIVPGQRLLIPRRPAQAQGYMGKRWVEIDLSSQTLTAWDDENLFMHVKISSGLVQYPTPVGHYNVWHMNESQTMSGPGYSLPNVKFNMYFHRGYAMHGAYWHNSFGQPMSHGCVNMTEADAERLYRFIDLGTEVWVHG
jgi:LysM repeat protein